MAWKVCLGAVLVALGLGHGRAAAQITIDGVGTDWAEVPVLGTDPAGDARPGEVDFGRLWACHDSQHLYLRAELGVTRTLQGRGPVEMILDTDNNASTGRPLLGLGAELVWRFGHAAGVAYLANGDSISVAHAALGLVTAPTIKAREFEVCLDLTGRPNGCPALFSGGPVALAWRAESDQMPDAGQRWVYDLRQPGVPDARFLPLTRPPGRVLRVMTYNTYRDGVFDSTRGPAFDRILGAIGPDVIGLEEVGAHPPEAVAARFQRLMGSPVYQAQVADVMAVSRFPLTATYPVGDNAAFIVDLSSLGRDRMLFVVAHPPCCNKEEARQLELDQLMGFVRDVRQGAGREPLPTGTPIVIVGDMNLVGEPAQQAVLVHGTIVNQTQWGPSFAPDWDGTPLTDLAPRHLASPHTFTWFDARSSFTPGRLDYVVYSDSRLQALQGAVLWTPELPAAALAELGLRPDDTTVASDHLPVVADFAFLDSP